MRTPPLSSDPHLRRVLAVARGDGWSVIVVAALGGALSLVQGGWGVASAAAMVIVGGVGELHGRRQLLRGEPRGLRWLIAAQAWLLVVVCTYAWWRWRYFDAAAFWTQLPAVAQGEITRQLVTAGFDPEWDRPIFLQTMNALVCFILATLTMLYQGGLALYYAWQGPRVRQALLASPPPLT